MSLKGVKVGDTIVVVSTDFRHGNPAVSEGVVVKVGRLYVTLSGWRRQFAIDSGHGHGDHNYSRAYRTPADYAAELEREKLASKADGLLYRASVRRWSIEKLRALIALFEDEP